MLYRLDKYKILWVFVTIIIVILILTLTYEIIERETDKRVEELIASRDTRLETKEYAEGISKGYLQIINIGGSESIKTFKENYRTKMEPILYEEVFGGLGDTGYSSTYKSYKVTDIKSNQTQEGGTTTVDVRMEVAIDKRNLIYRTEVVNGRLRKVGVIGTKDKIR